MDSKGGVRHTAEEEVDSLGDNARKPLYLSCVAMEMILHAVTFVLRVPQVCVGHVDRCVLTVSRSFWPETETFGKRNSFLWRCVRLRASGRGRRRRRWVAFPRTFPAIF